MFPFGLSLKVFGVKYLVRKSIYKMVYRKKNCILHYNTLEMVLKTINNFFLISQNLKLYLIFLFNFEYFSNKYIVHIIPAHSKNYVNNSYNYINNSLFFYFISV